MREEADAEFMGVPLYGSPDFPKTCVVVDALVLVKFIDEDGRRGHDYFLTYPMDTHLAYGMVSNMKLYLEAVMKTQGYLGSFWDEYNRKEAE